MEKHVLSQVIIDQRTNPVPDPLVDRWQYSHVLPLLDNKQVIVITGLRRCGKSTLLQMIQAHAKQSDYAINFDDDRLINFSITDFDLLLDVFVELYGEQEIFYFDEIQNIIGWERFVRRLHNEGKKVFVTGSNANLLSSELGTHLTGRHIAISLYPYSFKEYILYRDPQIIEIKQQNSKHKSLLKKYFAEFKKLGGLPEYLLNRQKQYLQALYENILYKDIIVRNRITLEKPIKELVYYLASNNCKEFSYNALRKLIGVSSANTVSNYCHFLENSFLCFAVNRFSYSIKEQINNPKKIYFIDQAMAEAVGFRFSEDYGRLLENIVFLQLKRQSREIYFHKQNKECDFLIRDGYKICAAIQVCASLKNQVTREREIHGLLEALAEYDLDNGLIITEDETEDFVISYKFKEYKIKVIPCWKWLLETEK